MTQLDVDSQRFLDKINSILKKQVSSCHGKKYPELTKEELESSLKVMLEIREFLTISLHDSAVINHIHAMTIIPLTEQTINTIEQCLRLKL